MARTKARENKQYIAARNALIHEAMRFTDGHIGRQMGGWSAAFLNRMQVLAVRSRLISETALLLVPDGPWMEE